MLLLLFVLLWPIQESNWNTNKKGVALDGYDPVSYFQDSPKEGNESITFEYDGVLFYFVSESNRQQFVSNPARYLPEYGGFCAYAMGASGEKVDVDPETFKVLEGKLYLFYNAWGNNTLKSWNEDEARLRKQADKNWQNFSASDR